MRVTVAGSSSSIPRRSRACSSYLVEGGGSSVALDLGTGSLANLRCYVDYDQLGAVVISHMHADHFLDLIPLRYALQYGPLRRPEKLPLYLPPGGLEMLLRLVAAFADEGTGDFLSAVYDVRTFDPSAAVHVGELTLRFAPTAHYIPAYAVRCEHGRSSVTYSADTAPDPNVIALARRTDLFICEATMLATDVELGVRGHCTALEAAEMARAAGAGTLMLTHYPEAADARQLEDHARRGFDGPILIADDHHVLDVASAAPAFVSKGRR